MNATGRADGAERFRVLTIANGGITSGLNVYVFLTSAAARLVPAGAPSDLAHVPPLDPLKALVDDFLRRGGTVGRVRHA